MWFAVSLRSHKFWGNKRTVSFLVSNNEVSLFFNTQKFVNWLQGRDLNPHTRRYERRVLPIDIHPTIWKWRDVRESNSSVMGCKHPPKALGQRLIKMVRIFGFEPKLIHPKCIVLPSYTISCFKVMPTRFELALSFWESTLKAWWG